MKRNTMLLSAIIGAASGSAVAQTDSPATMDLLEEVVVTAQRREENLLDLPLSATAFNGDMLKNQGVSKILDLQTASPSLSITDTGPTLSVNIRGIGIATNNPNITAGVATYVDGLFQPPIVQSSSFYDIDTVEVLRGPQGTFVGNNATGGAIFINTKDPQLGEFGGYGEMSVGNYSNLGFEGAVNIPVSEDLAIRLAGFKRDRDSFYDDIGPYNNDAGKLEEYSGRLGVLWNPGNFELLFKAQTNKRDTGGYAAQPIPGTSLDSYRIDDPFTVAFDENVSYEDEGDMYSLELSYELANGIVLRSLSGYQDKEITNISDVDGSDAPAIVNGDVLEDYYANETQWSQEINIISPTDGKFDWVLGAYYQKNDIDVSITDTQPIPFAPPGFNIVTDIPSGNKREITGFFAQGNYEFMPSWEVQVGVRHSTYEIDGDGGVFLSGAPFPPGGVQVADLSGKYDDDRTTGKIALNWYVNDGLVYAQASTGYKPGGFNSSTTQFESEDVTNYELGWKFSSFDNRVRTQLTAFYTDYRDFQFGVLQPETGVEGAQNIADMTIKGLEAQVQARFGNWLIHANAGYTESELPAQTFVNVRKLPGNGLGVQCAPGQPPIPGVCFDYNPFVETNSGGDALFAPEWTYSLSVSYELDLGNGIYLTPRVNYSHTDEQYAYLAYSPETDTLESRDLVSASLTLTNDVWKVELYGTNLTDEEYVSGQYLSTEFYGAPREYGLRVGASF